MKPPSLLDPEFKYVSSNETDIKKTFARIRRELAKQPPKPPVVTELKRRSNG